MYPVCTIGHRLSVIGYRLSVFGHRISVIGHRISVIGYRFSVFGHRISVIGYRSSVIGHRSSVIGHRLSVIGRRTSDVGKSAVGYRISAIGFRTSVVGFRSLTLYRLVFDARNPGYLSSQSWVFFICVHSPTRLSCGYPLRGTRSKARYGSDLNQSHNGSHGRRLSDIEFRMRLTPKELAHTCGHNNFHAKAISLKGLNILKIPGDVSHFEA